MAGPLGWRAAFLLEAAAMLPFLAFCTFAPALDLRGTTHPASAQLTTLLSPALCCAGCASGRQGCGLSAHAVSLNAAAIMPLLAVLHVVARGGPAWCAAPPALLTGEAGYASLQRCPVSCDPAERHAATAGGVHSSPRWTWDAASNRVLSSCSNGFRSMGLPPSCGT